MVRIDLKIYIGAALLIAANRSCAMDLNLEAIAVSNVTAASIQSPKNVDLRKKKCVTFDETKNTTRTVERDPKKSYVPEESGRRSRVSRERPSIEQLVDKSPEQEIQESEFTYHIESLDKGDLELELKTLLNTVRSMEITQDDK